MRKTGNEFCSDKLINLSHPVQDPIQHLLLEFDKFNIRIPAPDAGKGEVNDQMGNEKCPDDGAKHIDPPDPAGRVEVGEEFASAIPFDGPVEPPHDPVQMPLHPQSIEAGQGENGKLLSFHALVDRFPPQFYIPGDPNFYSAQVPG